MIAKLAEQVGLVGEPLEIVVIFLREGLQMLQRLGEPILCKSDLEQA